MARPSLPRPTTTLGMGPVLLLVLFPAVVAAFTTPFVLVSNLYGVNWPHMVLNLWLLLVLGVGYVLWRVGVLRGRLTAASGAGFPIAGYALAQRVYYEFLLSFLGDWRLVHPESELADAVALTRWGGLVAFVFGLAMVLAASFQEWRIGRAFPSWVRPR